LRKEMPMDETRKNLRLFALAMALCLALLLCADLLGQDENPTNPPAKRITLWQTIRAGGMIGWAIIFLSFVALGLVIEHAVTIRRGVLMPIRTLAHIRAVLKNRDFNELVAFCGSDRSFVAKVILAAFVEHRSGYEEMEEAMIEAGSEQTAKLYRKIEYLSVIGNISPMLGLLGTVVGMIQSFNVIAQEEGFAKPAQLASGISKALVTTLMGLIVAIPVLVAYVYFRNKVEALSAEAEQACEELMRPIKRLGMGGTKRGS